MIPVGILTAANTTPTISIVTTGLGMYLDAAIPASYSGTGSTWSDVSGNGNNATLFNAPVYSPLNSGYLLFNGTNQYFSAVPSSTFLFGLSDFSICCWVKFISLPVSFASLFDNLIAGGIGARNDSFLWVLLSSGRLDVFAAGAFRNATATTLLINTWYNLVLTRDFSGYKYYINTVIDSNNFILNTNLTSGGCFVAKVSDANNFYLNANIAVQMVYNIGLTQIQVNQNFNAQKTRYGY